LKSTESTSSFVGGLFLWEFSYERDDYQWQIFLEKYEQTIATGSIMQVFCAIAFRCINPRSCLSAEWQCWEMNPHEI